MVQAGDLEAYMCMHMYTCFYIYIYIYHIQGGDLEAYITSHPGLLTYSLTYLTGGDLEAYITSHPGLPESLGQEWTAQLLSAVCYLHALPVAHRDIKL